MERIVAFTGKARSGKDTSCALLQSILRKRGYSVRIFAFADNLKRTAQDIFNLTEDDLYGSTKETPQKFTLDAGVLADKIQLALEVHCGVLVPFDVCDNMADSLCDELKKVAKPTFLTRLRIKRDYIFSSRQIQQIWGTEVVRANLGDTFWIKDLEYRVKQYLRKNSKRVALISDTRFNPEAEWLESVGARLIEVKRINKVSISSHKSENGINDEFKRDILDNNGTLSDLESDIKKLFLL